MRTKRWRLCAASIVRLAHGLFPLPKTLKGSKGLPLNEIGQWKRAGATGVVLKKGCPTVANAKCSFVRKNGTSTFAANAKRFLVMI